MTCAPGRPATSVPGPALRSDSGSGSGPSRPSRRKRTHSRGERPRLSGNAAPAGNLGTRGCGIRAGAGISSSGGSTDAPASERACRRFGKWIQSSRHDTTATATPPASTERRSKKSSCYAYGLRSERSARSRFGVDLNAWTAVQTGPGPSSSRCWYLDRRGAQPAELGNEHRPLDHDPTVAGNVVVEPREDQRHRLPNGRLAGNAFLLW